MKLLFRVVILLALAAAARDVWRKHSGLAYKDTQGRPHSISAPDKPAVLVLWITPCPYCSRSLNVLDALRRDYPEKELDVVGLYLNRADDAAVDQFARQEGHSITVAQGQPSQDFVRTMTARLAFRAPGRDIYVIGKNGDYEAVDASDLGVADGAISERVRSILREKHGLRGRAG
jgi:hypothetical protein